MLSKKRVITPYISHELGGSSVLKAQQLIQKVEHLTVTQ